MAPIMYTLTLHQSSQINEAISCIDWDFLNVTFYNLLSSQFKFLNVDILVQSYSPRRLIRYQRPSIVHNSRRVYHQNAVRGIRPILLPTPKEVYVCRLWLPDHFDLFDVDLNKIQVTNLRILHFCMRVQFLAVECENNLLFRRQLVFLAESIDHGADR